MSDVWQGPGWWLASDGKWYPADAEPGAVYEGSLDANEQAAAPAPEAAPPEAAADEVAPAEMIEPAVVEAPQVSTPESPAAPPEAASPPVAAPATEEVAAVPAFTEDPFTQMPAPVIEEPKVGGWQAVPPDETPQPAAAAPISTEPAPAEEQIEEDGWTSAYEERQSSGDVLDDAASAVVTPDVQIPATPIPDVQVPDVQVPDVAAPTEVRPQGLGLSAPPAPAQPPSSPITPPPDLGTPMEATPSAAPPVVAPPVEVPEVVTPTAEATEPAAPEQEPEAPIERDDAWRKPLTPDAAPPRQNGPPVGAPDVVDLAIPDEPREYEEPPEGRNWALVGGILVGVLAIAGLAWLIASVFAGDDDNTNTDGVADGQASTTVPIDAPSTESTAAVEDADADVSVFALRAGDCIVGDIGAGQVTKVTKVDCEMEHQFEVYREALIDASITVFDEEAISAYAEEVCRTTLEAYIPPDDDRGLKFKFLQPTEDSWNQPDDPDRVITCLLFDEDAPLVGRAA